MTTKQTEIEDLNVTMTVRLAALTVEQCRWLDWVARAHLGNLALQARSLDLPIADHLERVLDWNEREETDAAHDRRHAMRE